MSLSKITRNNTKKERKLYPFCSWAIFANVVVIICKGFPLREATKKAQIKPLQCCEFFFRLRNKKNNGILRRVFRSVVTVVDSVKDSLPSLNKLPTPPNNKNSNTNNNNILKTALTSVRRLTHFYLISPHFPPN